MSTKKPDEQGPVNETAAKPKWDPARVKQSLAATVEMVRKLGAGATSLLARLKKDQSPEAMLKTIEDSVASNQSRRSGLSARIESLHETIVKKKTDFQSASPARKRILEAELATLLAEYRSGERELKVLLENERVLAQVRGRMLEVASYGMAGVTGDQIDNLVEEVEDAVADAEGRLDASRDLERAGRRKDRESDRESLWDQLGEFGAEPDHQAMEKALKDFEAPPTTQDGAARTPEKPPEE